MPVRELDTKQPDPAVIEVIEEVLDQARKGEVQSVVIVTSNAGYCSGNIWAGVEKNLFVLMGEMEVAKADLIGCYVDLRADEL